MYIRLSAILLSAVGLSLVSWGCTDDEPINAPLSSAEALSFRAMKDNGITLATRSENFIPVNPDDFGETVFYIYENGTAEDKQNNTQTPRAEVGCYWLESGMQGQLDIMPDQDKLNWFSAETPHLFWSWTWPLESKDYSEVNIDTKPAIEPLIFKNSEFPLPASAQDPDEETPAPASEWRNGEALEQLVGALTDRPYVFNEDGRYVPLYYKHLVSKIILGEFILVDNTGASIKDLKARITFYGMPKRAMFYPVPDDENGKKVAPYVTIDHTDPYGITKEDDEPTLEAEIKNAEPAADGGPFEYNLSEYVTFYITNEGGDNTNTGTNPDADANVHRDMFYICPEIDFTQLEYKVEFVEYDKDKKEYKPHSRYGNRGGYFGNFKSIQFTREVDGKEVIDPERILHAGEVMVLNMTVYEKSGPGAGVWIRNWDSEKLKSATHHVHNGIYSDAEAAAVRTALQSTSTSTTDATYEARKNIYQIYGEDEEGKKVIHLYNDVIIADTGDPFDFKMYSEKYPEADITLDGMGYTINFINNSSTNPKIFEEFIIGPMRDVYISNGLYTVYINPEGEICRLNEKTGKYEVSTNEDDKNWIPNVTKIPFERKG